MHWFFSYPTKEVSLNDLTLLAGVSKTTAHRVVLKLQKEGFLKLTKLGKLWRISCDETHYYSSSRKIAYNLGLVFESEIVQTILAKIENPRAVILFGSYRKGDDIEDSDLDVAVEVLGNEEPAVLYFDKIPKLGYRENVEVNVLKFSRTKIDINLFSNIANGIVLYGFLEAKP